MIGSIGSSFAEAEVIVYGYDPVKEEADNLAPPSDEITSEIARLTSQCLRMHGYSGNMKIHKRFDGRSVMKIKLLLPSLRGSAR